MAKGGNGNGNGRNNTVGALEDDDLLNNSNFRDSFIGGAGIDTANYRADVARVIVDLRAGIGTDGGGKQDTYSSIENIRGTAFNDEIAGDDYSNTLYGGAGNDSLYGRHGDDIIYGEAGEDYLMGGRGNDEIYGGTENDILNGRDGDDRLYGEAGDDILYGEAGNDLLDGGAGNDTVRYSLDIFASQIGGNGFDGVVVNLLSGQAVHANGDIDTLVSIENIEGSLNSDSISGDNFANVLYGNDGNDTIFGGGGNDTINGDNGNDTITGGAGNDSLNGGAGIDTLSYATDTAGVNVDILHRTAVDGYGDTDTIINFEVVVGSAHDDQIAGADLSDDTLYGGDGNDFLWGREGNDTLYGDAGNDKLTGGLGNDRIIGGAGNDTLFGEAGADTFVFNEMGYANRDYLMDFNIGEGDRLDLSNLLTGFDLGTDNINDFIQINYASASKSNLWVNADGIGNDAEIVVTFRSDMSGVTIDDLMNNNNLII